MAIVTLLAASVLAACSSDGGDSGAADLGTGVPFTTTSTLPASTVAGGDASTSTSSIPARPGVCDIPEAATTEQAVPATTKAALLTALQLGHHSGCDRIVFEFDVRSTPGYTIGYQSGPFTKGETSEPLEVRGSAFLVVRFEKASGVDPTDPQGAPAYRGPKTITRTGLKHVREIRNSDDFEAVLTWIIGVDGERPFVVGRLASPPGIYVELS